MALETTAGKVFHLGAAASTLFAAQMLLMPQA
jgi:hypothetical protein